MLHQPHQFQLLPEGFAGVGVRPGLGAGLEPDLGTAQVDMESGSLSTVYFTFTFTLVFTPLGATT